MPLSGLAGRRAELEWDVDAELARRIHARTLLVLGAESRQLTPMFAEAVELLAAWLPDATAVELPGVGHGMTMQDPAAVAGLVADFARTTSA